ncbi:SCP2 sterol-binding domain-containing protein [Virgibacillus kimchii]
MENKSVEQIWSDIEVVLEENKAPYAEVNAVYQFELTDVEEGTYQLNIVEGTASVHKDAEAEADCTLKMKEKHFRKFLQGDLNSTTAFMTGKLKVVGNIGLALKLENMLKQYDFAK